MYQTISKSPELYFIPLPHGSDQVYFNFFVRSGCLRETEDWQIGCGHLIDHYLFERFKPKKTAGTTNNASISPDTLNFYLSAPRQTAEQQIVAFLETIALDPIDDAKLLAHEKLVMRAEMRRYLNNPRSQAADLLYKNIFAPNDPYGRLDREEQEGVERANLTSLRRYREHFFTRSSVACFVGASEIKPELLKQLAKIIERLVTSDKKHPKLTKSKLKTNKTVVCEYPHLLEETLVRFTFPIGGMKLPIKDRIAFKFAGDLMTGTNVSSILPIIRRYGVYDLDYFFRRFDTFGFAGLYAYTDPKEAVNVLTTIERSVARFTDGKITQAELDYQIERANEATTSDYATDGCYYGSIVGDIFWGNPVLKSEELIAIQRSITLDDIKTAARLAFNPKRRSVGVVGAIADVDQAELLKRFPSRD